MNKISKCGRAENSVPSGQDFAECSDGSIDVRFHLFQSRRKMTDVGGILGGICQFNQLGVNRFVVFFTIKNSRGAYTLAHPFFNFSCAAGIRYTVDVSKKSGERVKILSLSDDTPFDPNKTYKVAINSYRGNGGGGHLSQGLGWSKEEMEKPGKTDKTADL